MILNTSLPSRRHQGRDGNGTVWRWGIVSSTMKSGFQREGAGDRGGLGLRRMPETEIIDRWIVVLHVSLLTREKLLLLFLRRNGSSIRESTGPSVPQLLLPLCRLSGSYECKFGRTHAWLSSTFIPFGSTSFRRAQVLLCAQAVRYVAALVEEGRGRWEPAPSRAAT